jgi:hypothetical protein
MTRLLTTALVCGVLTQGGTATGQSTQPPGRVQVGVGAGWLGGAALGEQPADLRTASGSPYRLFESETELASSPSFETRVTVGLSRRFAVEGRLAMSSPELRTVVSSDAETSGSFTLSESTDQYMFDGGVVVRFDELEGMGLSPFASAGAGYLRQLHEGQALVEQGHLFYVGGGFTRGLVSRPAGLIRGVGIRADFRLDVITRELDDDSRPQGSLAGGVVFTF